MKKQYVKMKDIIKVCVAVFVCLILNNNISAKSLAFLDLSGGYEHTAVVKYDGTVWTWGTNNNGEIGDGTTEERHIPIMVEGIKNVKNIETGWSCTVALKNDGTVWAWGKNSEGQLGDGTNIDRLEPVRVKELTDIKDIGGKGNTFLAVKNDGTVWTWGANAYGQALNGNTESVFKPIQITSITDVKQVVAGYGYNMALKNDGTVWAWGNNSYGQLGIDGLDIVLTPTKIEGLESIVEITAREYFSMALKDDGTVWSWGKNQNGQLGDGTLIQRKVPKKIDGLSNIVHIDEGQQNGLALKEDGTVWTWGNNIHGLLGNGEVEENYLVPRIVSGLKDVKMISAAQAHHIVLKDDMTLWAWGWNGSGCVGDNTIENKNVPVQVLFEDLNPTVDIESVDKAKIGDEIIANVVIHNVNNIFAEDIKLSIDTEIFEYISAESPEGIKIVYEGDLDGGVKRFITASLGEHNGANGDKILINLRLKAKKEGEGKIDVLKTRIADNSILEEDIDEENCLEKTIVIEGYKDVNRTGEFTLLDLGIDAWYYGKTEENTDLSKYDADTVDNGKIDEEDLKAIVTEIIVNKNYKFNN